MSDSHHLARAPGFRAIRFNMDWITRPLFGIALAAIAIGVLFAGPVPFTAAAALIAIPGAREWHRMVGGRHYVVAATLTAATVIVASFALLAVPVAGFALIGAGTLAAFALSLVQRPGPRRITEALWQAGGVLYIGLPTLALVGLRAFPPHALSQEGAWIIVGLFVIVWATDTGALICGNLIGGPRLAPVLSPAKTWAGTLGGCLTAALAFSGLIAVLHGPALRAGIFALFLSVAAHAGDLFESWVKRKFHCKNSGSLIPGHGGILDRMDSTIAAGLLLAILVFGLGLDPLFGVHPPQVSWP